MLNRYGMDRFKKAESAEPFSVKAGVSKQLQNQSRAQAPPPAPPPAPAPPPPATEAQVAATSSTTAGQGGSTWQAPDWAVDFKNGLYVLEVMKDGAVVDNISLEKRRALFGRQAIMCDYVLDHPSVSRQHAVVVQHKNGGVYVIDLGSVHGTFVANERLSKDSPVELEVGQSLRFAASTRSYVLRKIVQGSTVAPAELPANFVYPPAPDASDEEAIVTYNTALNKLGVPSPGAVPTTTYLSRLKRNGSTGGTARGEELLSERPAKRARKSRVSFRDEYGGLLAEVVGISDGADVSTEPGPIGVREGSLVGKYKSLVQVTVIPKGQQDQKGEAPSGSTPGVTQRLKQYLDKVKSPGKGGLYGDLYGDSVAGLVGGSWAGSTRKSLDGANASEGDSVSAGTKNDKGKDATVIGVKLEGPQLSKSLTPVRPRLATEDTDLFVDSEDRSRAAPLASKS